MSPWSKKERFDAVLSGECADRPLVIGWRHFVDHEKNALKLAEATVAFTEQFDFDIIKSTPRATYYGEVWGNEYDFDDYEGVLPRQTIAAITKSADLWQIEEKKVTTTAPLIEQLQAIQQMRTALPRTPIIQTVFSPLAVLYFLAGRLPYATGTVHGSVDPITFQSMFTENKAGLHHALHAISLTIADYVMELKQAGANGVFYSVMGIAHPQFLDEAMFNEFSRPYDSIVLEAASRGKTILHTCGEYAQPERFNDYRIDGISWDTEARGNPGLEAQVIATKVGGVDQMLFATNNLQEIEKQATAAVRQMKDQPFVLAPNCSIPNNVSDEALRIFRSACE